MSVAFRPPKERLLSSLADAVRYCSLCERMCGRRKVLSESNGSVDSRVLFVAEAPGRLGAALTGIPMYGDRSGDNFGLLLENIGWRREDVFITNAVLCNPLSENGNNDRPTPQEITNCSTYLRMVINLLDPEVVVTLGEVALEAVNRLERHSLTLRESVGKRINWYGRSLVPLYHPGPRALLHRSMTKQRGDFIKLAGIVNPRTGIRERYEVPRPSRNASLGNLIHQAISIILDQVGEISLFRLCKLLFLVDLASYTASGHTLTEAAYLRQADGPWYPELRTNLSQMDGYEVVLRSVGKRLVIRPGSNRRFDVALSQAQVDLVLDVLERYGHLDERNLKTAVYLSPPMRYVLRQEKSGATMRNRVILYKDTSIDQAVE